MSGKCIVHKKIVYTVCVRQNSSRGATSVKQGTFDQWPDYLIVALIDVSS